MTYLFYKWKSRASLVKESACSTEVVGSITGLGGFPGEVNGYPLKFSCLETSMGRGVWRAAGHVVAKSQA